MEWVVSNNHHLVSEAIILQVWCNLKSVTTTLGLRPIHTTDVTYALTMLRSAVHTAFAQYVNFTLIRH